MFFDEMDSIFRTRGTGISCDVETTIVPQLLSELDGVETLKNVIVIGASNREDLIDPAILRPGRLDVKIKIERPDAAQAGDIMSKYLTARCRSIPRRSAARAATKAAVRRMIQLTVDRMYASSDDNRFLEVTYASGDKEVLYFKDFNSGAMIENIVRRAKKEAIKRFLSTGEKGIRTEDLLHAIRDEFKENEDLPNTTNPDDWARISARRASGSSTFEPCSATGAGRADRSSASPRASTCKLPAMAIPKVIGIETEYGISAVGAPEFNPVLSSSLLISTYAGALRRIRWDYEQESPLRDARGFEPVQVREPAEEDLGLANVILPERRPVLRGPRAPRVLDARVRPPARAGRPRQGGGAGARAIAEEVQASCRRARARDLQEQQRRQGELVRHPRELPGRPRQPFGNIVRDLTPFFVSRQIFTGAGKLGGEAPWDDRDRSATSSPSGRTSSRPKWAWRRRSSGRSSTPATSLTPIPTSTGGST